MGEEPRVKDLASGPHQYQLQLPPRTPSHQIKWAHKLFRGPGNTPVKIYYSSNKSDSEDLAKWFLKESVVGFDMK